MCRMYVRHSAGGDASTSWACAGRAPAVLANHVGLRPRFVEEDQPPRVQSELPDFPLSPAGGHVRPILLSRVEDLFYMRVSARGVCALSFAG